MKLKSVFFFLYLFFCSCGLLAQRVYITGRLIDPEQKAVGYAGLYLYRQGDSVHLSSSQSDSLGYFKLPAERAGNYQFKVRYIGYQAYSSEVFRLTAPLRNFSAGNVHLVPEQQNLRTVEISGVRPTVQQLMDKTVLNIENSLLGQGGHVLELLSKLPGVTADESGTVSLKGRPGTNIMINGKLTYLSASQLANLLRGTSSAAVSRIELMSNPSARYDAAGKGGIINIILKKNIKTGLNGTLSLNTGAGKGLRWGSGGSLNYKNDRVNVFGNYTYVHQNLESTSDTERQFSGSSLQHMLEKARLRAHNFRAGMDLFVDEKSTIGFLVNGAIGRYPSFQDTKNELFGSTGEHSWDARTNTLGREHWKDWSYNLNFVHKFDDQGHELSLDADYVYHFSAMDQHLDTRYLEPNTGTLKRFSSRKGDIPSRNDVYVAKLDYTLPFGKQGKLEAGWKGSLVKTDNNLRYDTLSQGNFVPDLGTTNHFKYKEQIQALYLNLKQSFGQFSIQAGLRGEYTQTQGHQLRTDSIVNRNYFKLFPSLFLSHKLNEQDKIQLGYSRRMERPGYWDLNSFRIYTDPFSYEEGNPYLRPAMVNAFELSYSFRSNYHVGIFYNNSTDVLGRLNGQSGPQVIYSRPMNLATFVNYGANFNFSWTVTSWWNSNHFLNLFRNEFNILEGGTEKKRQQNSVHFDAQHYFKPAQGWKLELNGLYRSREVSGIFSTKAYYMINAGIQKELFKGKGNLNLLFTDLFKSKKYTQWSDYQGISIYNQYRPDSRSFSLSLSYRFGAETAAQRNRNTGAEELKSRLK